MAEHALNRMPTRHRWLVIYTRPRYERKIERRLLESGIEVFLPTRMELRQWSDRRKKVEMPLFPSYIFVHVDERKRLAALEVEGVVKYVHFNGRVAEVRAATIDALRRMTEARAPVTVEEAGFELGQEIRIRTGPLAGLHGRLVSHRGAWRVGVLVEVLEKLVTVEVPVADLTRETSLDAEPR